MSSSFIRFTCPKCNRGLKASEEKAGTAIACPHCKRQLTIPARPAPKPPPVEMALLDDEEEAGEAPSLSDHSPPPLDRPAVAPGSPPARTGESPAEPRDRVRLVNSLTDLLVWHQRVAGPGWVMLPVFVAVVLGTVSGFIVLLATGMVIVRRHASIEAAVASKYRYDFNHGSWDHFAQQGDFDEENRRREAFYTELKERTLSDSAMVCLGVSVFLVGFAIPPGVIFAWKWQRRATARQDLERGIWRLNEEYPETVREWGGPDTLRDARRVRELLGRLTTRAW